MSKCFKFIWYFFRTLVLDFKETSWGMKFAIICFSFIGPIAFILAICLGNSFYFYVGSGIGLFFCLMWFCLYYQQISDKATAKMEGLPILDEESHTMLFRLLKKRLGLKSWTGAIDFLILPHKYCDDQQLAVIYSDIERLSLEHDKLRKANEILRRSVELRENDEQYRSFPRVDSVTNESSLIEVEEDYDDDEGILLLPVLHRSRHPSSTSEEPSTSSTLVTTAEVYRSNSDESD